MLLTYDDTLMLLTDDDTLVLLTDEVTLMLLTDDDTLMLLFLMLTDDDTFDTLSIDYLFIVHLLFTDYEAKSLDFWSCLLSP